MNQLIPFNQSQGGTTPNMCLANVTAGYGIPNYYASAWQAWEHTEQHLGDPPLGIDVPVYFSYTATINGIKDNYGHIGVRLSDGQFWSDGHVYPNIGAYTANHSPKYLGWGESVNNVKVIGDDMDLINKDDTDLLRIAHSEIGGWNYDDTHSGKNDATFHAAWDGHSWRELIRTQWTNGAAYRAEKEQLKTDNKALRDENAQLKQQLAQGGNGGGLTDAQAAQLDQVSTDVSWMRKLLDKVFK